MDYPKSVPSAGLVNGKFVDENPLMGTPGSLIPASWGNGVTSEILEVITAAGLTPSESNLTQLLGAIRSVSRSSAGLGIQRFTANGSFTVPAGVTKIWLSGCAGGGGGGACPGGTSAIASGGGGGGAGQPIIKLLVAVTPGQVIPIVIGAAGMGATAGVAATAGGNTLVGASGALLVLSGGSAGIVGVNASGFVPGPTGGQGFPAGGDATDTVANVAAGYGDLGQVDLSALAEVLPVPARVQGMPANRRMVSALAAVVREATTFRVQAWPSQVVRERPAL